MNNEEINNKLKQIKIEDYIWVIYIGIILLSWYSNNLERNYYIFHDFISKEKYRNTLITIFSILVVVYFYFFKSSIDDLKKLKQSDSEEKKKFVYLSFIASLLIAVSGIIFLYIAYNDKDISVELAFN